jgi:hypothetical protein
MTKYPEMIILIAILSLITSPAYAGEGNLNTGSERNYISYSLNRNSWTSLSGTTNINSFECLSEIGTSHGIILADSGPDDRINFSDASLLMNVNSFDCKNPIMNRDMYKALGGEENSVIDIRLLDAELIDGKLLSENGNFRANAEITINGQTNPVELLIDWYRSDELEYHFTGSTELSMSAFGITPPSPALGLIKVNDKITVQFNYIVQPSVISRLD